MLGLNKDAVKDYRQLTSVCRTHDFELPDYIYLAEKIVTVPERLKRKDVHYLLNDKGEAVRACWISKPLGFILNAFRLGKNHVSYASELKTALTHVDMEISSLVKNNLLKNKQGPGAMSFVQTNDHVSPLEIVISERSYRYLCSVSSEWEFTRTVSVVRFPNLGPKTTIELTLVVNTEPTNQEQSDWRHLIPDYKGEELPPFLDCFLLHHSVLKNALEGDCDGDIIFIKPLAEGRTTFKSIPSFRVPGDLWNDSDLNTLFSKSSRLERVPISKWIPSYLDNKPISKATYIARWSTFKLLPKFKATPHPMHYAWEEHAPKAINLVEFVMDVRKGNFTENQIQQKASYIDKIYLGIIEAQKGGNWFAKTVTASHIEDVAGFIKRFPRLKSYLNYITGQ